KRGPGGQVDIEFLVQMFQLRHGAAHPDICVANTWSALAALLAAGLLSNDDHATLAAGYDFLRLVESRLRLMLDRARDECPESEDDQEKLARRLGLPGNAEVRSLLREHTRRVRQLFISMTGRKWSSA